MKTTLTAAIVGILLATGLTIGSGSSTAAPQLQRLSLAGETLATGGDHAFCRGVVALGFTAAPHKRGVLRITLTSLGFTGDGAGWKRNPQCRFLFGTAHTSIRGLAIESFFPVAFGPQRGQRKSVDINTGSGLVDLGVTTYAINSPVRVPQSQGTSHYVLVP